MDILAAPEAKSQQQDAAVAADGQRVPLRSTRAGQQYTADWKTALVLGGDAFNVTVGGVAAGADVSLITGGGAGTTGGTTMDTDQPELAIGTPAGYYHIPLGFTCAAQVNPDEDLSEANIILFADTCQEIPSPVSTGCTIETPQNLLDGGRASVSNAESAVNKDITDPVCSQVLGYATLEASQVTATGSVVAELRLDYDPSFPVLLKGPCSVIGAWGGTTMVHAAASYEWAEVPIGRFA